jgi:hypothetical protein
MTDKNIILEGAFLLLVFFIVLTFGFGGFLEHKLSHDVATGPFLASDSYQNLRLAQAVFINGDFRYTHIYNEFDDVVGEYAAGFFMIPSLFSIIGGLQIHDSVTISITLIFIMVIFAAYMVIRSYNKVVALCSLPLMLFLINSPFNVAYLWGQWALSYGVLLLFLSIWFFSKIELNYSWIFLGSCVGALSLTHQSELIMFCIVAFFVSLAYIYTNLGDRKKIYIFIRKIILSALLALILFAYFLPIFVKTQMGAQGDKLIDIGNVLLTDHFPERNLRSFGIFLIPILLGVIVYIFLKKEDKKNPALISLLVLSIIPVLNYLGGMFAFRALMVRFFWPATLSIYSGLCIYFILSKVNLKKFAMLISLLLLLVPFFYASNLRNMTMNKVMNEDAYDAYIWIRDNTPNDSRILFISLFGRTHEVLQDFRDNYYLNGNIYKEAVAKNLEITNISTKLHIILNLPYYKGFFKVGSYAEEKNIYLYNLCEVDYLMVEKRVPSQEILEYNQNWVNNMLNDKKAEAVFNGNHAIILKFNESLSCKKALK